MGEGQDHHHCTHAFQVQQALEVAGRQFGSHPGQQGRRSGHQGAIEAALAQAGVELLVIETQFDINEAKAAVMAVRSVSDLPLVCSVSFDRGKRTMMGVSPAQVAQEIGALAVDLLGINCGRSLEDNLAALKLLHAETDKPLWFKPNAGLPKLDDQGQPVYDVTPSDMAEQVPAWLAAGAQVVGGCCGTSPSHLAAIAAVIKS